jgi:hypothetical protein
MVGKFAAEFGMRESLTRGGGALDSRAYATDANMDSPQYAGGHGFFEGPQSRRGFGAAHGLQERTVSEHSRVLGSQYGDVHDSRKSLHAVVPVLFGAGGAAASG